MVEKDRALEIGMNFLRIATGKDMPGPTEVIEGSESYAYTDEGRGRTAISKGHLSWT